MSADATPAAPIARGPRRGTSVQLGAERIGYLDRLAAVYGTASRTETLLLIWPRSAAGAYTRPPIGPPRAPLPVHLRAFRLSDLEAQGEGRHIAQLSGPAWRGDDADVKIERLAAAEPVVSLSRLCRAVIDAHAAIHAAEIVVEMGRGRAG